MQPLPTIAHQTTTTTGVDHNPLVRSDAMLPQASRPFPQCNPARTAAIATLFGLAPPNVATARVLELGCASGGNLILLAAQFPGATFTGVDLSGVQIAEGQARVEALGLGNITLKHQSIADIGADRGQFDYIICHGIYSSVPEPVRKAIFRVARENLTANGIAYISYNVFPGWRLRGALRDALQFHTEEIENSAEKVQAGRVFLARLAEATDATGTYGQLLRREAQLLTTYDDQCIAHEFLAPINDPCHVADFIHDARDAGLEFLAEANLNGTLAETIGADAGTLLRDLSGNWLDRLERLEQYTDFLTGRMFRQSLLVQKEQVPLLDRRLSPERIDRLHIAFPHLQAVETDGQSHTIRDVAGRTLVTSHAGVRDCLAALGNQFPQTSTIASLIASVCPDGSVAMELAPLVRNALFKMAMIGMADLSTVAFGIATGPDEHPEALRLARLDAEAGRSWTTNARHETVSLNVVQRAILPDLDGTRCQASLVATVEQHVADGRIRFQKDGQPIEAAGEIDSAIREHITSALAGLAKSGLLLA